MTDTGWRRNKYGGLFNINEVKNKKVDTNEYMNKLIRNSASKKSENKSNSKEQFYELYHGSKNTFDNFDDKHIGERSLGGLTYGKGHYFLSEKSDVYGQEGYKVKVKLQNPYIVQERKWSIELERMGYDWFDFNRPDPSDFLASKGYDATIIKNEDRIAEVIVYTNNDKKIQITDKFKNY